MLRLRWEAFIGPFCLLWLLTDQSRTLTEILFIPSYFSNLSCFMITQSKVFFRAILRQGHLDCIDVPGKGSDDAE